ncbi:transglycosylase SLT domain-containing protein [Bacteroidota bacterium]
MMKRIFYLFIIFARSTFLLAQSPTVPDRINIADIELKLTNYARKEIQMDVNALHKNAKYFNMKLVRVNQYFPIIERIFKEENVPDDFKYLVIQESALIPDAVSSANAVGFWQFKKETGMEVGLRIDRQIDERMNIVSSTYGASKYLKKNNFYLKNWMYALSAYQAGLGGVEQYVNEKYRGAKKMEINKQTHWYVKKFLAHKIAFQEHVGKNIDESLILFEYTGGVGKTINQIANEFDITGELLHQNNKWLKSGRIPEDKIYTVTVPGYKEIIVDKKVVRKGDHTKDYNFHDATQYPVIKTLKKMTRNLKINGIPGLIAMEDEDIYDLINAGNIDLTKFLKFNDIDISHHIESGQVYYLKRKRGKAREYFHIVYPGESLWSVSQKYGIRVKSLMSKNRMKDIEPLKKGRILWLRYIRPVDEPIEYRKIIRSDKSDTIPEVNFETKRENELSEKQIYHSGEEKSLTNDFEDVTKPETRVGIVEDTIHHEKYNILDKGMPEEYLAEIEEEEQIFKPAFHLVEAGETLYALSKKYDVKIEDLLIWKYIQ